MDGRWRGKNKEWNQVTIMHLWSISSFWKRRFWQGIARNTFSFSVSFLCHLYSITLCISSRWMVVSNPLFACFLVMMVMLAVVYLMYLCILWIMIVLFPPIFHVPSLYCHQTEVVLWHHRKLCYFVEVKSGESPCSKFVHLIYCRKFSLALLSSAQ